MVGLALSLTFGGLVILRLPQLPDLGMLSMRVPAAIFGVTFPLTSGLEWFYPGSLADSCYRYPGDGSLYSNGQAR